MREFLKNRATLSRIVRGIVTFVSDIYPTEYMHLVTAEIQREITAAKRR